MAAPKMAPELWTKLIDLPLDRLAEEPAPEFGFTKRLMRDEGWSYTTTIRVIAEYRRFLLLAHLGPVSPSPKVDAAWHLHLTYTRAYNLGLCARTLGHPLDHTPSGDAAATAHYAAVYEDTLNRYRKVFNEEPPADIWGTPKETMPVATAPARKPGGSGLPWAGSLAIGTFFIALFWIFSRAGWVIMAIVLFAFVMMNLLPGNKKHGISVGGDGCGSSDGGDGGDGGGDGGGGCGGGGCG